MHDPDLPHDDLHKVNLPLPANENQDDQTPDDDAADLAALIAAIKEKKDDDTELDADDPAVRHTRPICADNGSRLDRPCRHGE